MYARLPGEEVVNSGREWGDIVLGCWCLFTTFYKNVGQNDPYIHEICRKWVKMTHFFPQVCKNCTPLRLSAPRLIHRTQKGPLLLWPAEKGPTCASRTNGAAGNCTRVRGGLGFRSLCGLFVASAPVVPVETGSAPGKTSTILSHYR